MNTATMNTLDIKALLRFAADQDVRYYLNGVLLDFAAGLAVATDGHRLLVAKVKTEGEGEVIIPRELLEDVVRGKQADVVITAVDSSIIVNRGGTHGTTFKCEAIDGRYPDWRRIIPSTTSGELAHFNPQYVLDAHRSLAELRGKPGDTMNVAPLQHNGDSAAVMVLGDAIAVVPEAIAVIMPTRTTGQEALALARVRLGIDPPPAKGEEQDEPPAKTKVWKTRKRKAAA